jgi:predicted nucleic acid-binding protein
MATAPQPAGLIDTTVLIDAARGDAAARTFLADQQSAGGPITSVISAMELARGCRNAQELAHAERLLRSCVVHPVTTRSSRLARQLITRFALSHGLQIPDALIAAVTLERRLVLYTHNERDFRMIPSLAVVVPY